MNRPHQAGTWVLFCDGEAFVNFFSHGSDTDDVCYKGSL